MVRFGGNAHCVGIYSSGGFGSYGSALVFQGGIRMIPVVRYKLIDENRYFPLKIRILCSDYLLKAIEICACTVFKTMRGHKIALFEAKC